MKAVRTIAIVTTTLAGGIVSAPAASAGDRMPPTAPTDLRVVRVSDTSMTLAWNASRDDSGVVNYELFFDGNPTPILTSEPQWTQPLNRAIGMVPGSTHTFRVRAEDMSGNESAFSNTLISSYAPGDSTPPTTPQNLRVVSNTVQGIELAWDPSRDQSSPITYNVLVSASSFRTTGTRILIAANDPITGTTPGSTHTFRISAGDPFQNVSPFSAPITATFSGG